MTRQMSFTSTEKELIPEFREKINHAEGVIDLQNFFSQTVIKLLHKALSGGLPLTEDDIRFDPDSDSGYKLSPRLQNDRLFREIMENSDLEQIIRKFASTTAKHYARFRKHTGKTPSNIRI
ncbi:MAG: hypothetical protein GXO69_04895 [Acidobacteria bacterium]|nr:hypothetical protein [Acidobacteriota bacterium]